MAPRIRSLLKGLTRRSRFEDEMRMEMRAHMEQYAEDLVRRGVDPEEARRQARLEFGSVERVKEECRQARGLRLFDEFRRNLRYAARLLVKNPGFTATAVLTLGLCIGANTAVFSIVDAVLLRPLPYPEPERLVSFVTVWRGKSGGIENENSVDGAAWEAIRDHASLLDAAVVGLGGGASLAVNGRAQYVEQARVSAGYFRVLGVPPFLGREFSREEDRPGSAAVAILSHSLWRRAFGGDPGVIGRAVSIRGEPCTIVGVMPEGFLTPEPTDLWTPLRPSTGGEGSGPNYGMLARLRPGVSAAQAQAQLESIRDEALRNRFRDNPGGSAHLTLVLFQRDMTRDIQERLLVLLAAAGLILLIGCTNIAGLLLARAAGRTREIATRMALGGGRAAVVRQMLTETLLLSLCGGLLGVFLGYAGARGLVVLAHGSMEIWQPVRLDLRLLAATFVLSLFTAALSGVLPPLLTTRLDIRSGLASRGGRGIAGGRSGLSRRLLIVGEVALGIVLLVGAGLLVQAFAFQIRQNPGFDPRGVVTAQIPLRDARYATVELEQRLVRDTLDRIRQLPGVESAAMGLTLPFERPLNNGCRRLDGPGTDRPFRSVNLTYVSPEYFGTLRIPVLRGRVFTGAERKDSELVAMVNEAFVRRVLPNQEPVGSHIAFGMGERPVRVVGVVRDVLQRENFTGYEPFLIAPGVYVPLSQMTDAALPVVHTWFSPSWIVRSTRPESEVSAGIARAIEAVDPLLPVAGFSTMEKVRAGKLAPQRTQAVLLGIMSGLALLLAAVGIYGLIANSVVERTRELGIRMALGAGVARTIGAVARSGVVLALVGIAIGCPLARFAVRWIEHIVFGVKTTDPATFAVVSLLLLAVACAASVIPALRLAGLNPSDTLRQE